MVQEFVLNTLLEKRGRSHGIVVVTEDQEVVVVVGAEDADSAEKTSVMNVEKADTMHMTANAIAEVVEDHGII